MTRSVNAVYKGPRIPEDNTHPVGAGSPANTGEAGAIHRASSDLYRTFTSVLTLSGNDCGLIS
ncbi:hypothetical protein PPUN110474_05730 [Pseudomonas putida]|nr:hypothetical protein PPUN110474_05730 [Pseudomonas putida]